MTAFENKIADFIKVNALFDSSDKALLAVSGGADSTALLQVMCSLKKENSLSAELLCAHINHQLRGAEADSDEDFVIKEAAKRNLAVITRQVDVRGYARSNKLSIETAARKLRIESLLDIAKSNDCNVIMTAHQKNDNAETIIQRLVRGTGFRGLGGIWPKRVFADDIMFVRPLLCVRRDEIIEYLKEQNLKWREDHTNVDCSYRRNFIRLRLLPLLQQQCNSSIVEQLFGLSGSAQRFHDLVCSEAEKVWNKTAEVNGETASLNLNSFSAQPQMVKVELVRRSLTAVGSGERDLTHQHYEKILQIAEQKTADGKIALPNGFAARKEYVNLIFEKLEKNQTTKKYIDKSTELKVPGRTQFGRLLISTAIFETNNKGFEEFKAEKTNSVEWFDLDKVKLPLFIRSRQAGDRFVPLGLREEKKVGKFLTAAKVPQQIRKNVLIVADNEKVIWVWPIRISEQVRLSSKTQKILRLKID